MSAVPGKGRGRVISAGPEPHPGVTSPWPSHYARGARVRRGAPAPIPGAVGVSRPTRPHRRLSRRRRWTRLTRSGLVDPCRHSDGRAESAGTGTSHQAEPGVKAQVQAGPVSGPRWSDSESAWPLLTKEPRGGTHCANPEALVWERDRSIHQGPIRGGQNYPTGR